MTIYDVQNYLEKIYGVSVLTVRTKLDKGDSLLEFIYVLFQCLFIWLLINFIPRTNAMGGGGGYCGLVIDSPQSPPTLNR